MPSKDPELAAELDHLLKYLNDAKVTKRDMIRVMDECERRSQEPDWQNGDGMFVIAMMCRKKKQIDKAQALYFRFLALTRILESGAIPAYYAMPKKEDGIPGREVVLEAAATQQMIAENDKVSFERESFIRRCLKAVETESKQVQ